MTTRQLVLIRHAKAADGAIDIERPLAARGHRDAAAIGQALERAGIVIDRVVVSPALRARQTWDDAHSELSTDPEVVVDKRIYDNTIEALLDVIHDTADGVSVVALVGHNPSMAELAEALDDSQGAADARAKLAEKYPTGAFAVFAVGSAWAKVGSATLTGFEVPRG